MSKILRKGEFWILIFLFSALSFIYRDVILKNKIVFSSNLLASFYSPWATQKFEGYPNGIPNKPIGGNDQVRVFYPYRTFINESFKKKEFPLWNPYNFSGSPIIANFQSAVFYPLNIIYFLLPQITAWSLLVIIQPLLGTLFMYLYLRQFIKQKLAAFFGAFAFGFSGFILTWSQENAVVGQTALWFPLILLAVDQFIQTFKLKYFILLVFSLSFCIFAGHIQPAFYIFFIAFLYGLVRIKQAPRSKKSLIILFFLLSFLVSFMITAIQLLPSIEALNESPRASSSNLGVLNNYLLPISRYISVFAPDIFGNPGTYNYFGPGFYHESIFYIGIIPLVFAVLAIRKIKTDKLVHFFTWVTIISFIFGIKSFFTQWFYQLPIPLINTFTPSRIFFVTSTALAILSAFGFSYWLEVGTRKTRLLIYSTIILFASILIIFIGINYIYATSNNSIVLSLIDNIFHPKTHFLLSSIKISLRNLVLPLLMLFSIIPLTLLQSARRRTKVLIVLLFCLGQLYFLNKYVVIGGREFLYPDHFVFSDIQANQNLTDRFLSFGLPILGDVGIEKHVYSPDGIDPVFPKRYGQLVFATKKDGRFDENIETRIEANLSEYADNYSLIDNQRFLKLINLLGVTRIYNYEKDYKDYKKIDLIFPNSIFKPLWKRDNWQAYENTKAFPRAFLVDDYIIEKNPQKTFDLLFDQNFSLLKTVILEEKPDNFSSLKNDASITSKVSLEIYKPQYIQLKVNTDTDKILFLSDNYYPGWKATIDQTPTKIYRADFAFRAIVIPKGEHTVEFLFKPLSFKIGALISVITLTVLSLFVCRSLLKPSQDS